MNEAKEFFSKSVDEAIAEACSFYSCSRDELEITILEGGSSGIFGLVGAKKARIKAQPRNRLADLDEMIRNVAERLCSAIVHEPRFAIEHQSDMIKVTIASSDDELLIGREGQTLSALEYIVGRIVARRWPNPVRIMLDANNFRERQDEELRVLALEMAEKVMSSGQSESTKPLPSYHRRIVHLTLQNTAGVQTRSKGDGPLKRVLVLPRVPVPKVEGPQAAVEEQPLEQ
jgi:spoIIIJ-associated protein